MKSKFTEVLKNMETLKNQATRIGADAGKTAKQIKKAVENSIKTSRFAVHRAKDLIDREKIDRGIELTSKGVDLMAKGARMASKGAGKLANNMEKASDTIRKMGKKNRSN